jgi:choline dehydrogenase-like flavoprotein
VAGTAYASTLSLIAVSEADQIIEIQWDAWKEMPGVLFPAEGASGNATGVFYSPNSINPANKTRSYSRTGHYDNPNGAASRPNFHLLPGNRVLQVILDRPNGTVDWEAQGVIITPRDGDLPSTPLNVRARKEVILSAGSVHTPQILQRSGVGPREPLENAGVKVKVNLPGVGYNLQDHAWYHILLNCECNALARRFPYCTPKLPCTKTGTRAHPT